MSASSCAGVRGRGSLFQVIRLSPAPSGLPTTADLGSDEQTSQNSFTLAASLFLLSPSFHHQEQQAIVPARRRRGNGRLAALSCAVVQRASGMIPPPLTQTLRLLHVNNKRFHPALHT